MVPRKRPSINVRRRPLGTGAVVGSTLARIAPLTVWSAAIQRRAFGQCTETARFATPLSSRWQKTPLTLPPARRLGGVGPGSAGAARADASDRVPVRGIALKRRTQEDRC